MEGETWRALGCQMLTCHQEETKERARGFTAAESFLLSIPLIFLCSPSHLHGRWAVSELGKVNLLSFVDPQARWTTAKINQIFSANGDQAPNLLLKGSVRLCGWCFSFLFFKLSSDYHMCSLLSKAGFQLFSQKPCILI